MRFQDPYGSSNRFLQSIFKSHQNLTHSSTSNFQGLGLCECGPVQKGFFRMFVRFFLLGLLIQTVSSGRLRFGRGCRCPTSSANFNQQYYKAYKVVRAYVLSNYISCDLCESIGSRKNAVRVYQLYTSKVFKGSSPGTVFYAQAFENTNFCGVRLREGDTYMLNLADPKRISAASHWKKGRYVLDACQSHYNWKSLSRRQQQFLYSRI